MPNPFNIPVLIILFNRPDFVKTQIDSLRKIKPTQIYVAGDGPRINNQADLKNCEQARNTINLIDWSCEIKTLYQGENLGCGKGVSTALNWFFDQNEKGIVLEDDCIANEHFFYFCEKMLNHYENDHDIMHINGSNHQLGKTWGENDFYFSSFSHCFGWASWQRAWKNYQFKPDIRWKNFHQKLRKTKISLFAKIYWTRKLVEVLKGKNDTWDYQWQFAIWLKNGICITPNKNLVTNIGYSQAATHTRKTNSLFSNQKAEHFEFDFKFPKIKKMETGADQRYFRLYLLDLIRNKFL